MTEDLRGAHFDDVDLRGASFHDVSLNGARMRMVDLTGLVVRAAEIVDVELSGEVEHLVVNGVDVAPLVEAALDRRYPDRARMRPDDPAGYRDAWAVLERLWAGTVERARALPEDLLHQRVDGEWSVVENLRHLVFATDAWVRRAVLGDPAPWDPLDLPHDEMPDSPPVPRDLTARPSLDRLLELRADRMATVAEVIGRLTDEDLAAHTTPVDAPGYPEPGSFPVRRCLRAVLNEEWQHRLYIEHELDHLGAPA